MSSRRSWQPSMFSSLCNHRSSEANDRAPLSSPFPGVNQSAIEPSEPVDSIEGDVIGQSFDILIVSATTLQLLLLRSGISSDCARFAIVCKPYG